MKKVLSDDGEWIKVVDECGCAVTTERVRQCPAHAQAREGDYDRVGQSWARRKMLLAEASKSREQHAKEWLTQAVKQEHENSRGSKMAREESKDLTGGGLS